MPGRAAERTYLAPLALLLLFVFLSGLAALVYQVLWLRLLALVFGVTVWAASTVLATFMGGLALGSFSAARLADRVRHPLRWYALAEIGIGISALATPFALEAVEGAYLRLAPLAGGDVAGLTALRVALSCAVLLVPTTLMGATLPLIVRAALARDAAIGERVSLLYATNTAGAIAGVLLAGFWLVGSIGIGAAFAVAASLNAAVGVAAFVAARRDRADPAAGTAPAAAPAPAAVAIAPRAGVLLLAVFTLSGFASFALEVAWFRILVFYVAATTYAFTLVLAAVLGGIAAGSYAAAAAIRAGYSGLGTLVAIELALGVATLFSLVVLARSTDLAGMAGAERALTGSFGPADLAFVGLTFGALLPAAFLFGLAFPIGLHIWMRAGGAAHAASRLGLFYGLNVLGAIAGSLAAGFVLLPWLGSQGTLVIAAIVSAASGLALLTVLRGRPRAALGAVGAVAFVAALAVTPDPFATALERRYEGERLLWREEGVQSTVSVHVAADGARVLYLDGLHQANDRPEMVAVHQMIGHLPMILHPDPRRVLVVGLGGGATAGAVARHSGATVDIVELSPEVVRAAAQFDHVNGGVTRRPNVRMRVDDARNHLLLHPGPYDVITADIIQPHHAGAGNVYSAEYFRLVRAALADDGIVLQWLGPFPETRHKLIARTFISVFPETTLWAGGTLMVGSKRPLQLDPSEIARALADPTRAAALAEVGIRDVASVLALYSAGPDELRAYAGEGPVLTDDRPLVEYFLSLPLREPAADLSHLRGDVGRIVRR